MFLVKPILLLLTGCASLLVESHDEPKRLDMFRTWFQENGGFLSSSVGIVHSLKDYNGLGLVAKTSVTTTQEERTLPQDSCVIHQLDHMMTIPKKIMIHANETIEVFEKWLNQVADADEIIHDKLNRILSSFFSEETQQMCILAIRLQLEKCFHSTSFFSPYLDILPQTIGQAPRLDTFSEQEWDSLLIQNIGTFDDLKRSVMDQKKNLRAAWEEIRALKLWELLLEARQKMEETKVDPSLPLCSWTWEYFHHFFAVVESRVMQLNGVHVMMPVADLVNFSPSPPAGSLLRDGQLHYPAPFSLYHYLDQDNTVYQVHADRPVMPNHQIFEDYGVHDVRDLAQSGGFVPTEFMDPQGLYIAQEHYVTIPTSYLWDTEMGSRNYYLWNVTGSAFLPEYIQVRADGSLSSDQDAGRLAMVVMTSQDDAPDQDCFTAMEQEKGDYELIREICTRYPGAETRVRLILQNAAKRILDLAKTSLKKDLDDLPSLDGRAKVAVQLRIIDKQVLALLTDGYQQPDTCQDRSSEEQSDFCPTEAVSPRIVTQQDLDSFNSFVDSFSSPVSKIKAAFIGDDGMRVGVIAKERIKQNEIYFSMPLSGVVDRTNLTFPENPALTNVVSRMHETSYCEYCLEIFLMYEYFVQGEKSKWWPYLNLIPSPEEIQSMYPFFLEKEQLDVLAGSDTRRFLIDYQTEVHSIFEYLTTDFELVKALGPSIMLDKDKFLWAYHVHNTQGITWGDFSHLLPMIDNINCNELLDDEGKPMRGHTTLLNENGTATITRASRTYQVGEQLYENYAEPNYVHLTSHGFVLENNSYDCALVNSLAIQMENIEDGQADVIWEKLLEIDIDSFNPSFCIGGTHGDSLEKVKGFLRVAKEAEEGKDINKLNVNDTGGYDLLAQWLDERIQRCEIIAKHRQQHGPSQSLSQIQKNMLLLVQQERRLFEQARQQVDLLREKQT